MHWIGWLAIASALGVTGLGLWLDRRYGHAIRHEGIGRRYSLGESALAFLGNALVLVGLIGVMIAAMLTFA